jgi:hypothetical protein
LGVRALLVGGFEVTVGLALKQALRVRFQKLFAARAIGQV